MDKFKQCGGVDTYAQFGEVDTLKQQGEADTFEEVTHSMMVKELKHLKSVEKLTPGHGHGGWDCHTTLSKTPHPFTVNELITVILHPFNPILAQHSCCPKQG